MNSIETVKRAWAQLGSAVQKGLVQSDEFHVIE